MLLVLLLFLIRLVFVLRVVLCSTLLSIYVPVVLSIISVGWIKVITSLYCANLCYYMIKVQIVRLTWCTYSTLPSSPYMGNHLSETY